MPIRALIFALAVFGRQPIRVPLVGERGCRHLHMLEEADALKRGLSR